jgi:hypothetical protein
MWGREQSEREEGKMRGRKGRSSKGARREMRYYIDDIIEISKHFPNCVFQNL